MPLSPPCDRCCREEPKDWGAQDVDGEQCPSLFLRECDLAPMILVWLCQSCLKEWKLDLGNAAQVNYRYQKLAYEHAHVMHTVTGKVSLDTLRQLLDNLRGAEDELTVRAQEWLDTARVSSN